MTVVHLQEVIGLKLWLKLLDEERCIISADTKGYHRADVAKDCITDHFAHLGDVLVGDGEVEAVFACLREDGSEGIGGEVLKLIDVEIKWRPVFDIGNIAAAHGGQLDLGDDEGAEDTGIVFTDQAFAEVYDQDLAFVHHLADVEGTFRLTDDITDDRVGREGTDFVEDWRDGFSLEFVVPAGKLDVPEIEHHGISTVSQDFFAELLVGQHTGDVEHRRVRVIEEREDGIA